MKMFKIAMGMAALGLMLSGSAYGQSEKQGQGQVVVTILPKQGDVAGNIASQGATLKVNGKESTVTGLVPFRGEKDGLDLVILMDGSSRSSLGNQFDQIGKFAQTLPPNVRVALAYMQYGRAVMVVPFTTDHSQVLKGLHLPAGAPGSNGSPYFCISDLAKNWPGGESNARREVLMITDGVDEYNPRYDPEDPYLQQAINDAVRARLVIYAIYFRGTGRLDNTRYENNAGQNLIIAVTAATGGKSFWEGIGNPVSFEPYLDELTRRFRNQYELSFITPLPGKATVEGLKLKLSVPGAKVDTPEEVYVVHSPAVQN